MLKTSLLVKIVALIVLGFGGLTTMMYYQGYNPADWIDNFPGSIYEVFLKYPKKPEITLVKAEGSCGVRVYWWDNEDNEDGVRLYRSVNGGSFKLIRVTLPHLGGPGTFDDGNLKPATYVYKVSVFNAYGESFSDPSDPIAITDEICNQNELPDKPLNPLITAIEMVKNTNCTVRLYYQDNSNNEAGIRVYRWSWNDPTTMIAELPASNAPTGSYDDEGLQDGHYTYQMSVFNASGESYSNVSDEIEVNHAKCNTAGFDPFVNPLPINTLTFTPTATNTFTPTPEAALPSPTFTPTLEPAAAPQACIWTALINTFIRSGPGASLFPELAAVTPGTMLPVVGQSEDEFFWAVALDKLLGYVSKAERFGSVSGDCSTVPVLTDPTPPPPTSQPVPQCSDGIDNDHDGAIDMRDRGCSSPNDNSEK